MVSYGRGIFFESQARGGRESGFATDEQHRNREKDPSPSLRRLAESSFLPTKSEGTICKTGCTESRCRPLRRIMGNRQIQNHRRHQPRHPPRPQRRQNHPPLRRVLRPRTHPQRSHPPPPLPRLRHLRPSLPGPPQPRRSHPLAQSLIPLSPPLNRNESTHRSPLANHLLPSQSRDLPLDPSGFRTTDPT